MSPIFCYVLFISTLPLSLSSRNESELVTAYQCTSDYAEVINPPPISSDNGMIRVCIEGTRHDIKCQKVIDSTIRQSSKSIEEAMVVNGQQHHAFIDALEVTAEDGKCMLAAFLTDKYFIRSTTNNSLKLVMSGYVSVTAPELDTALPKPTAKSATTIAPAATKNEKLEAKMGNSKPKNNKKNAKSAPLVGAAKASSQLRGASKSGELTQTPAPFEIDIELTFGEEPVLRFEFSSGAGFYELAFGAVMILSMLL